MDLDLVFLGTSGSMPTAQRAPSATLIRRGGERLLFDCAEGTQRQLLRSTVGLVELREVFLTHYHADHYLGLPGMLKTFALRGRTLPITIYGPPGLRDLFVALRRIFGRLTYRYDLVELPPGTELERGDYVLRTFPVAHEVSAVGYALVERERPGRFDVDAADALGVPAGPERGALQAGESVTLPDGRTITPDSVLGPARAGRTVVLAGDTAPAASVIDAAYRADVLVHEATFCEEERERAHETAHTTAADAAEIARRSEVGLLVLTHLSNRYFGPDVAREARAIFPDTVVPKDFDVVEVPFPERGRPRLVKGGALPSQERSRDRQQPLDRSVQTDTQAEPARPKSAPPSRRLRRAATAGRRARIIGAAMSGMVQVAVAGDVAEAEEIQTLLREAGIDSELEAAVEHDPAATDDVPQKVLVPESSLEAAQDAIEALTEPDELISEA